MPLPALDFLQVGEQRLHGLDAGVFSVAVDDLARQRFCHPALGCDLLPCAGAALAQLALHVVDDGFHAAYCNPTFGIGASPFLGLDARHRCGMRPRDTLAANIRDLTAGWQDANKHKRLHRDSGIHNDTLERIEKAAVSAGIDWLEPLAKALGVEPWELLAPPDKRAQLRALFNALQAASAPPAPPQLQSKRSGTDG